ncbi:MAG: hypothetical protein DRQ02_09920 [Candidatus Latescibacterota bacterium]|nr:MAG: hypothetical protein DRQ02_09920 [Candidatus Latescibacterota bacterium]
MAFLTVAEAFRSPYEWGILAILANRKLIRWPLCGSGSSWPDLTFLRKRDSWNQNGYLAILGRFTFLEPAITSIGCFS